MPLPSAIPTEEDLGAVLQSAGVITAIPEAATVQYEILTRALGTAMARLSSETGWFPFEGESQTRKFTGDMTSDLYLDGGLLDLDTLTIGDSDDYTVDVDYWLHPANAVTDGLPYTRIELGSNWPDLRNTIEIEGTWGRMSPLNDEAVHAVLACAALVAGGELLGIGKAAGPLIELVQGPVRKKWSDESSEMYGTFKTWCHTWDGFVARHRRMMI